MKAVRKEMFCGTENVFSALVHGVFYMFSLYMKKRVNPAFHASKTLDPVYAHARYHWVASSDCWCDSTVVMGTLVVEVVAVWTAMVDERDDGDGGRGSSALQPG